MKKGDVTFYLGRAECVWAVAVFVEMSSSSTKHAFAQVGAPFLAMPLSFAPLALHSKLLVSPVPWAVDCLDHARDVVGRVGRQLGGESVNDVVMNLPVRVSTGEGVGGDHQVCLCIVQAVPRGHDVHCNVSCLVREPTISLHFCC